MADTTFYWRGTRYRLIGDATCGMVRLPDGTLLMVHVGDNAHVVVSPAMPGMKHSAPATAEPETPRRST